MPGPILPCGKVSIRPLPLTLIFFFGKIKFLNTLKVFFQIIWARLLKASVVITTYNNPDYLRRVLEGYLNQTRLPDEILIADDGSTKDTFEMLKVMEKDSPVRLVHVWHEDRGFRAASIRNKAIAASIGEYIILSDGDTVPSRRLVEDHLRYSEEGRFIQGHRVLLGPEASKGFRSSGITLPALLRLMVTGGAGNLANALRLPVPVARVSVKRSGIRSCNMSFFRKDILGVNGFNEDFEGWGREDSELVERFYKYGLKRKDLKFRGCCYHLYHKEFDRASLDENTRLLEKTAAQSSYYCANGIDKYLAPSGEKGGAGRINSSSAEP